MIIRHRLRRHPIPVTCRFEQSLVVTWALPADTLAPLVPPGLTLDTYDGRWGFVVVAAVHARRLRPRGLPPVLGSDHALVGTRLFVRHRDQQGRERRGLHILRSETDRRTMQIGGNLLTRYHYRLADIHLVATMGTLDVRITVPGEGPSLHVAARVDGPPAPLPASSPFRCERDARRFAGPLPWTFDHEPETDSIVMIRGRRSAWRPRPVAVDVRACPFLERSPFREHAPTAADEARLANAFHIADLDYGWDRGVRVPLHGRPR